MASDRIEELKTVQFPTERRGGYDRRAVDAFLAELADWLETGGEDEARRAVIQRAMGEVGERTGSILASAQESADKLTADAEAAAGRTRSEAEQGAAKLRSEVEQEVARARADADAYSTETRGAADEHARLVAEAAAAEAKAMTEEAEQRLRDAEAEAAKRTRGIEEEIAALVRKRRDVVANLEQLDAEMRLAIEGPGERDLGLPERVAAAVESPDVLPPPTDAAGVGAETEVEVGEEPAEGTGEAPTTVSETVARPGEEGGGRPEPDTEERERRRRAVDSIETPTEDTKLADLL